MKQNLTCFLLVLVTFVNVIAADVKGSKDHPLISRYAGSEIWRYSQREYDEYSGVLGPAKGAYYEVQWENRVNYEGRVTRILYKTPPERSALEVFRNYEKAMKDSGFQEIFACSKDECGGAFYMNYQKVHDTIYATTVNNQRYLAAKLTRPEGDVYAFLHVSEHTFMNSMSGTYAMLDVVEMEPMEENMVVVNAESMAKDINQTGHVALYGIYFDTDKADLKPESESEINEIATMLRTNPELRVMVVGHTDNQGDIQYNMDLSHRRATAVRDALVNKHNINIERLGAVGMGFFGPVASNRTEEGRSLNRRVELVEF